MKTAKIKFIAGITLAGLTCALVAASFAFAQQNRAQRPQADLKITYKVSMGAGGNAMPASESTSMIKGVRERTEDHRPYGGDSINITQCDLRRTIQLSDKTQKYIITPMDSGDTTASSGATAPSQRTGSAGPTRQGGVITYNVSSIDTGERKEMFGFTARHVKTSMRISSSPDACSPLKQHIEQDGWYIDLNFGLNCEVGRPVPMGRPGMAPASCRDRIRTVHEGAGRAGFPLIETTTIFDQNDQPQFSTSKEVTELSRQPLDAALFDIPSGYSEARDSQELMGQTDTNAMMAQARGRNRQPTQRPQATEEPGTVPNATKRPGTIRIGVVEITNKTDRSVSTESLRTRLIGGLQGSNVEAVPLNASSASEADAEAKNKQCDFVLYTDISSMKLSAAKALGGMLGRATGVGSGGMGKTEAKLEFKLIAVGESSPRLQATASAKEEGDDASAGTAVDAEAKAVSSAAKKRS
jgi:hypothetical protein